MFASSVSHTFAEGSHGVSDLPTRPPNLLLLLSHFCGTPVSRRSGVCQLHLQGLHLLFRCAQLCCGGIPCPACLCNRVRSCNFTDSCSDEEAISKAFPMTKQPSLTHGTLLACHLSRGENTRRTHLVELRLQSVRGAGGVGAARVELPKLALKLLRVLQRLRQLSLHRL